jgi:hypothetical protein
MLEFFKNKTKKQNDISIPESKADDPLVRDVDNTIRNDRGSSVDISAGSDNDIGIF